MKFFKIFFIFILFLALIVLDLSRQLPKQISPIFIISLCFLLRASSKNQGTNNAFIAAIMGGFLLDLYSIFSPGLFILSILTTFYLSKRFLLSWINLDNLEIIFLASLIISLFYQVMIFLFGQLFYFLSWSEIKFSLDKFSLFSIICSVLSNSLLAAVFASIPKLSEKIKLKKFYR